MLHKVANELHKFGEALDYYYLRADGTVYLFTENQLKVARVRASRKAEIKRGWWRKFF